MKIELSRNDLVEMVRRAFPSLIPSGYEIIDISRTYGDVIVEIHPIEKTEDASKNLEG